MTYGPIRLTKVLKKTSINFSYCTTGPNSIDESGQTDKRPTLIICQLLRAQKYNQPILEDHECNKRPSLVSMIRDVFRVAVRPEQIFWRLSHMAR